MCSLHSNSTILNSKVVSVIVKPNPNLVSTPVEIEFPHLHNVSPPSLPICNSQNGGKWGGEAGDSQLRLPAGRLLTAETRPCDILPDICSDTVTFCSHLREWKRPRLANWTAWLTAMRNLQR